MTTAWASARFVCSAISAGVGIGSGARTGRSPGRSANSARSTASGATPRRAAVSATIAGRWLSLAVAVPNRAARTAAGRSAPTSARDREAAAASPARFQIRNSTRDAARRLK